MSPPTRDQLLKTANVFLQGFNDFTPEAVTRLGSPNCTYRMGPMCLNQATKGNDEIKTFVKALQTITPTFELKLVEGEEMMVDVEARKVAMHLRSYSPTVAGLYQNEYIFIIKLSEDGTMVDDVLEFTDSLHSADMLPKMAKACEEAAAKSV
ncbi:hypothetical protein F4821DRAFT_163242 [Hypoxylon rubiginosum]|uniref:Uncharacterized protein n=1 Tax=Hypoxylon rubiginosum TaxID=110542 RepID=A0ACC0CX44_9PEZI|nr:hypothetical protein F4821DRAFT_163242 [Hypoxylon rubiginosum]